MARLGALLLCLALAGEAQETLRWTLESATEGGRLSWHPGSGTWTASGGVRARFWDQEHGQAQLQAERISFDRTTGRIRAEGGVVLFRDGQSWQSGHLEYQLETGSVEVPDYRTGAPPFFLGGGSAAGQAGGDMTARDSYLTTDDYENPNLRLVAARMELREGGVLLARNVTFRIGSVPVFYLPRMRIRLERAENRWTLIPGYRSRYGAYLLSTYRAPLATNLAARIHLDYRSLRGPGVGPELQYSFGRLGSGRLLPYYLHDRRPQGADPDRHRLFLEHQAPVRTNLSVRAVLDRRGDPAFLREFFESEHRQAPQPRSWLEAEHLGRNLILSLMVQPRINSFQERVERLPELRLDSLRQQVGSLPVYYEGESRLGYLSRRLGREEDYRAGRLDSWHQLVLPRTALGWLHLVPRAGARLTHYTASEGSDLQEQTRLIFNTGVSARLRASRTYPGASSRWLDVKGLRHIVQPSLDHVLVPDPSEAPPRLPRFDGHVPSLLNLPLQYSYENAIDSIAGRHAVRLGLRQRLQTLRDGRAAPLADWSLSADWNLDPGPQTATLDNLDSRLSCHPRQWIELNSRLRYHLGDHRLRLADHWIAFQPQGAPWSLSLGHFHLDDEPGYWGTGSNLLHTSLYYQFNENWGVRASHRFEAGEGVMEEQSYTLYRDFRSWTGALTLRVHNESDGRSDYTIATVFSLKAAPRFELGDDTIGGSRFFGR